MLLWVEALESGVYPQGFGWLNDGGNFCCLGVACEVAIANGVSATRQTGHDHNPRVSYDAELSRLPASVTAWLGEQSSDIRVDVADCSQPASMVYLNDYLRWDFKAIAAALRSQYLGDPQDGVVECV